MGLYSKYCEADIYELIRLKQADLSTIRRIENECLFARYHGRTAFGILMEYVRVLKQILEQLKEARYPPQYDAEENEVEHVVLRRFYYLLACHTVLDSQGRKNSKGIESSRI